MEAPVRYRSMTPREVLAVFRAQHDWACDLDEVYGDIDLTFETTVAQWRETMDLLHCGELGQALNDEFDIACSRAEWSGVFKPERQRRLRDVCELVASHAMIPKLDSAKVLGVRCRKARVFLALREMLRRADADVSGLRPSSALVAYSAYWPDVYNRLMRAAPGLIKNVTPLIRTGAGHLALGAALFIATIVQGVMLAVYPWAAGVGLAGTFAAFLLVWHHSAKQVRKPPKQVVFEGMATFRDLSQCIAEGWQPRRGLRCPRCRYPLIGLSARRCPECGRDFSADEFGMTETEFAALLCPEGNWDEEVRSVSGSSEPS